MTKVTALFVAAMLAAGPAAAEQNGKQKTAPAADASTRSAMEKMGIEGRPSTLVGCAGGSFYTTHSLGAAPARTRIRVDVQSGDNIDPIATLVILQMGANVPNNARAQYVFDDDSGGNSDPRIEVTTEFDGNVVLSVGSYSGSFGCYFLKVDVTVP